MVTTTRLSSDDTILFSTEDYARERLSLLERVQEGHEWSARVVATNDDDQKTLADLQKYYKNKQCSTIISTDEHGRSMLDIRHYGKESDIADAFQGLGAIKGTTHAIKQTKSTVTDALTGVRDYMDTPMKILSGCYFSGDVLFFLTALGDKRQGFAEWLKAFSVACNFSQSFILNHYGEDDSVMHLDKIKKEIDKNFAVGNEDTSAILQNSASFDSIKNPILKKINDFLEAHPTEAGVAVWNLGQAMVLTSGIMRWMSTAKTLADGTIDPKVREQLQEYQNNAKIDVTRSLISSTGWFTLLTPQKHTEEKTSFFENPFARIKEEVQEAPQHISGVLALLASFISLGSTNPFQKAAEGLFIAGDTSMFFLDKDDYGQNSMGNQQALTKAITGFLEQMPIVFSPSTQQEFVKELSDYLVHRAEEKIGRSGKTLEEGLSEKVQVGVLTAIAEKNNRFAHIATQTAILSNMFPEEQRATVTDKLCDMVVGAAGIKMNREELVAQVRIQQNALGHLANQTTTPPSVTQVSDGIAHLTFSLPPIASTENALDIFSAVTDYLKPSPKKEELFQKNMVDFVANKLDMPVKDLHDLAQHTSTPQVGVAQAR
ncbi:MAG: hypothetical protein EAY65_02845 [Alphaproteobacteria bacterium]|nr:MAG: hypothetical protein EAY65_02845 [Alphaproteobacteria bacterium]